MQKLRLIVGDALLALLRVLQLVGGQYAEEYDGTMVFLTEASLLPQMNHSVAYPGEYPAGPRSESV